MSDAQIPLRLGIIGSGSMARTRTQNIATVPMAQLVAVASRNEESGAALASASGCAYLPFVRDLLDHPGIDAVIICTHNESHGDLAITALERGLHVLVEYPLALNAAQAIRAVETASRHGRALQVGYDQVWLGPHAAMRDAVGLDGVPLEVRIQVTWAGGHTPGPFRNYMVGGTPGLVKSYYLYAVLEWLGMPTEASSAVRYRGLNPDGSYEAAIQQIALRYPSTLASITWLQGPPSGARQQIEIVMAWASHTLHTDGRTLTRRDADGVQQLPVARESWDAATSTGLRHFVHSALHGDAAYPEADLAAHVVRLATEGLSQPG